MTTQSPARAVIEMLHPTPEGVTGSDLSGAETAQRIAEQLEAAGLDVALQIFVDDVVASQRPAGSFWCAAIRYRGEQLQSDLAAHGLVVDWLQESEMFEPGLALVEQLRVRVAENESARLSEDGRLVILGSSKQRQRIKLMGYRGHTELPSCEVMDLAAYRRKLETADLAISVLPECYRDQQNRVKRLAELLSERLEVTVIYVDDAGVVTDVDYWQSVE